MAMTADGKVSGPQGNFDGKHQTSPDQSMSAFGSKRDHDRLLGIRASMDAVMCGRLTVESANIDLGHGSNRHPKIREQNGLTPFNKRIVVSASGKLNRLGRVFQSDFSPILVATTPQGQSCCEHSFKDKPWVLIKSFGDTQIDFLQMVRWLHKDWKVRRLVVEGGGTLNDAMFRHQLVDEIFLTICPFVFGGRTNATISDGLGFDALQDAARFKCVERKRVGSEMFLRYLAIHT